MASYDTGEAGIGLKEKYETAERLLADLSQAVKAVFNKENEIDALAIEVVEWMKQRLLLLKPGMERYQKSSVPNENDKAIAFFYNVLNPLLFRLARFYERLPGDVKEKLDPSNRQELELLVSQA